MRILIFGGDGMLGHRLLRHFAPRYDTRVTLRQPLESYRVFGMFDGANAYGAIDVRDVGKVQQALSDFKPEAVINAAGVIKQRTDAHDDVLSIEINSFFPLLLARMCRKVRARLIHISTDCVFSGSKGNYTEADRPDPVEIYGYSKLLGEVALPGCITLRTSIIGRELSRKRSLFEWFLAQRGEVHGYMNAIYTGFTTIEMARILEKLITQFPASSGIYHVSSSPISKFDLLSLIRKRFKLGVTLAANYEFKCDRSLDSTRFRHDFSYTPPTWESMIDELAVDVGS